MTAQPETRPARYFFDEVFALDIGQPRTSAPVITEAAMQAAVAAARAQGREEGLAEGRRTATEALDTRLAAALESVSAGLAGLAAAAQADRAAIEAAAIELALTAAGRLAPALVAREPAAELDALLRACLAGLAAVPHVAIRVSEDLVAPMRERFEAAAAETGFAGRAVILGDPGIAAGDGRIEWADGGIVRDLAASMQAIRTAVDGYAAAGAGAGAVPAPKE